MKRFLSVILVLIVVLSGCNSEQVIKPIEPVEAESLELWVVTELTYDDKMNEQIKKNKSTFCREHDGVTIKIDILPIEENEREVYLESLRIQILAGEGPDIYLLPTDNVVNYMEGIFEREKKVELLFPDVAQAMDNGLFCDISQYYDADTGIERDRMVTGVMDAGVYGGGRYVLPLRYDIPVMYAVTEKLAETSLDIDAMKLGIMGLYETTIAEGDQLWACGAEYIGADYGLFGNILDYQNDQVTLDKEKLADYLLKHQAVKAAIGGSNGNRLAVDIFDYIQMDMFASRLRFPMYIGSLEQMLTYAAMAKGEETELTMIPLRGVDGLLTAEVTYYGAISANCKNPELAYEFLRLFLLEESQWEQNRRANDSNRRYIQTDGLVGPGWPVLTEGSVEALWPIIRSQASYISVEGDGRQPRKRKFLGAKLTSEDCEVLSEKVDQAYFPVIELNEQFQLAVNRLNGSTDCDALAEELIWDLQWHVAEG